jgi:hypothetical protein
MIQDDGDIVRACGFLAIYAGNLEAELDELCELAQTLCPELAECAHLRFADKARHLRKALKRNFESTGCYFQKEHDKHSVNSVLRRCKTMAHARNEILHSSIYADRTGRTLMYNKRNGICAIRSGAVYKLANEVHAMHGSVYGLQFAVARLKGTPVKAVAGSAA